ncbi:hypothetical protein SEA_ODAY_16 [Gordonia phage ODay]|nr:hypothetical protein SEA_ODAY_16 [Gordonia phage ODay]
MKRALCVSASALALASIVSACGSGETEEAPASTSTLTKTVVDNRGGSTGMRTSFSGGEDELVVGTDIMPGSYRFSGAPGSRCIYVVNESKGGEVVTGATLESFETVTVQLDREGTSVETSSTCPDWLLVSAAS